MSDLPAGKVAEALRPLTSEERQALARAYDEAPTASSWDARRCQAVLQQLGRRIVEARDLSADDGLLASFTAIVQHFYGPPVAFDSRAQLLDRITIMLNILGAVGQPRAQRWRLADLDAESAEGLRRLLHRLPLGGLGREVWSKEWERRHWGQPNYLLPGMQPLIRFVVSAVRAAPALPRRLLEVGSGRAFIARELYKTLRHGGCRIFTSDLAWLKPLPYLNADLQLDERMRAWQFAGPRQRRNQPHPLADEAIFIRDAAHGEAPGRPYHRHANAACAALPYRSRSIDCVVGAFLLSYTEADLALAECARVLSPGGRLALLCHHPASIKSRLQHDLADRHRPLLRMLAAVGRIIDDGSPSSALPGALNAVLAAELPVDCQRLVEEIKAWFNSGQSSDAASLRGLERRLLHAATAHLFPYAPFDDAAALQASVEAAGLRLARIEEITTAWEVNRAWGVVAEKPSEAS